MTPNPGVQIELARRELTALQGHQSVAEFGIELLSKVAAELGGIDRTKIFKETNAMLSALMALSAIRLSELQTAHTANAERIAQLEGFLAKADSRIAIPNLQV